MFGTRLLVNGVVWRRVNKLFLIMQHLQGQVDQNDIDYITQRYGAPVLGLPCPWKNGKIHPHVSRFLLANGKQADVVHVKPIYYETIDGKFRPLSEVTSYHGNRRIDLLPDWDTKMSLPYLRWLLRRMEIIGGKVSIPFPSELKHIREGHEIFLTTSTFYPDPNPETTTVDGVTSRGGVTEVWATIRAATATVALDTDASQSAAFLRSQTTSGNWRQMMRGIFGFNTATIPDTDTIDSATFSIYGNASTNNFSQSVVIDRKVPASPTSLATGDHDVSGWAGVEQASTRISIASFNTAAYNDFTINATGIGNINKTGVSWFGTRFSGDFDNSEPGWSSDLIARVDIYFADQTGTANDPKLVVVHSAAANGNFFQLF